MKQTIENDFLSVSVQQKGIELCSIKSKKTGIEYMWDAQPQVWASHAPVLFPVIGQVRENGYQHQGKRFTVPRHGFVRNNNNFQVAVEHNCISYTLKSDADTLAVYPFEFVFKVNFRLENNSIHVEHTIENTGSDDMLFSLGGHPAFRCPLHNNESYNDYYLEFEKSENSKIWPIEGNGLIGNEPSQFFDNTNILKLDKELFKHDALVFKDLKSRSISLKSQKSAQCLTVSFKNFPYMGIWAKYGAEFVCIEPWMGIADMADADYSFENKEGLIRLAKEQSYQAVYSIRIDE